MTKKTRYDLIPAHGLLEVSKVLTSKLDKYEKNQWKYGLPWMEVVSSMKKHLTEFELGHDFTEEGLLHMAEVANQALIICEYYNIYPQGDDRIIAPVNKPIIALDIDDTVLDFTKAFQKRFNIKLNPYWDGHYKMGEYLKELESDKEFWINLEVKNPVGFLPNYYVTARNIPVEWTEECIQKNGLPCVPVYSVPWNISKIKLLKELKVDIMIDDKYQTFKECQENGIFCYLMDGPTNSHYKSVGHRRIYNLQLNLN